MWRDISPRYLGKSRKSRKNCGDKKIVCTSHWPQFQFEPETAVSTLSICEGLTLRRMQKLLMVELLGRRSSVSNGRTKAEADLSVCLSLPLRLAASVLCFSVTSKTRCCRIFKIPKLHDAPIREPCLQYLFVRADIY